MARGGRACYRWAMSPQPPVMALHGFTGTGGDFEAVGPDWFAPDIIGHGTAPAPRAIAPYAMGAEVERMSALLPRGALLVGYSMGGRLALALAVEQARRGAALGGLVLIGASPGLAIADERAARVRADRALADHIEAVGVEGFLAEWARKPIIASQRRIESAVRAAMAARRRAHRAWGLANSLRGMGTGAMTPLWTKLDTITCPALLVTGAEDEKFTAIAARMAARLPDAQTVVLAGAGHCAHLEAPAAFAASLAAWRAARGL